MAQTMIKTCNTDYDDEKIVEAKRRRGVQGVSAVGLSQLGFQHSEDAVATLDSKEYAISQSALAVLRWKREKLVPVSDIAILPMYFLLHVISFYMLTVFHSLVNKCGCSFHFWRILLMRDQNLQMELWVLHFLELLRGEFALVALASD